MKKILTFALALVLCASMMLSASATNTQLSDQNLTVDGKAVNCVKYNIDGYNYFKLRDLAALLNGTKAQFSVSYNAETNSIEITDGEAYTAVGGELATGKDLSSTAVVSTQTLTINGWPLEDVSVYNIGGNNYFRLRDLANYLSFYVNYDSATRTAQIFSRFSYNETYTYDADGNLLSDVTVSVDGEHSEIVYTYENGLLTSETMTSTDSEGYCIEYYYYADGKDAKWVETYFGETTTTEFDYDERGYLSKETSSYYTRTITCDNSGNIVRAVFAYNGNDSEGWTSEYTYDAAGNRLTSKCVYTDGDTTLETWTYDENGMCLTDTYQSSWLNTSSEYTYDRYGNMLSMVYTDKDVNMTDRETYTYTLDSAGRPLTCVTSIDGVDSYREIYTYDAAGRVLTYQWIYL